MVPVGARVLVTDEGINKRAWGLANLPEGDVVGHLNGFNVVHLRLLRDFHGMAKGPTPESPGWLFRDSELEVL